MNYHSREDQMERLEQGNEHQEVNQTKKEKSFMQEVWEWGKAIAVAFILAMLIRTFLFFPTIVSGPSMLPTLHDGERLIVNRIIYTYSEPKRGDIIVFHATEKKDYIKRVIGVGGDTVEVRNDTLYINGKPVAEPYLRPYDTPFTYDFGPVKVPEGEIFVMGDNRRNSLDSRDPSLGTIPLKRVVGRAEFVIWPLQNIRLLAHQ